ncbi:MAG TPA: PIN domain-containing protein [Polyangiaceae bacterium]
MIAIDTSVAVAAFATWHERHAAARAIVDSGARLVAHCGLETYSVLTRLPSPHRAPADAVSIFLEDRFPEAWLSLPSKACAALVSRLAAAGIVGGATYDGLVAAAAAHAGATLATCDHRAVRIYEAVGVRYRLVE